MRLQTSCELKFQLEFSTPFIVMLRPRSGATQWVASQDYVLSPSVPASEFTDAYGNLCQRFVAPPGPFSLSTKAIIETADVIDIYPGGYFVDVQALPEGVLQFLLPSRYCESDRFGEMAAEITANQLPGYDQVAEIERWLHRTIRFEPGSSFSALSAIEVNQQTTGVCRDLSHLGIALCRSLSIPARMVVGYLYGLEPMELHAWFEAYVADRWYTFDATQTGTAGGYVAIGYGRDAADVAVFNQFGPPAYPLEQNVSVELV